MLECRLIPLLTIISLFLLSPFTIFMIMSSIMEDFDHLKIDMEDIRLATSNFSKEKRIGGGGFGPVYKGELSLPSGPTMVAYKRLDRRYGQGNTEFWKEVMMLSKYKHENLISLLHFSTEGDERVLVYEYAPRGSLDSYLGDATLTWKQRLHICIGAARALDYLHNPTKAHQRLLHRDIKSSNILLDENWSAKVSDFGLSKVGPTNQAQTYLVSTPVGTIGYCDPLYWELGVLSKESDVYSFGVVLFEVMCGRLCCEYRNNELTAILVSKWKKCYDENKLDDIIFQDIKGELVWDSLLMFATIAKRCLDKDRKNRPTMHEIVVRLEDALGAQEDNACGIDFFKIINMAVYPLRHKTRNLIISDLYLGILVNRGFEWIWLNERKQMNQMISVEVCMWGYGLEKYPYEPDDTYRFSRIAKCSNTTVGPYIIHVNTYPQWLSADTTYTLNLLMDVYKTIGYSGDINRRLTDLDKMVSFKYKLDEETDYRHTFLSPERENGWGVVQLFQVTNVKKEYKFTIELDLPHLRGETTHCKFQGIEFRAI